VEAKLKVVVDRIEGDKALLVDYEDESVRFTLPVSRLPEGTRGGDHLRITFTPDDESREAERRKAEELLKELGETPRENK
jgi:hypothetical protein